MGITLSRRSFLADKFGAVLELQVWVIGMTAWVMAPGKVLEHLQPWIPGAFQKRYKQATDGYGVAVVIFGSDKLAVLVTLKISVS